MIETRLLQYFLAALVTFNIYTANADQVKSRMVPLHAELTANTILAWKREQPISLVTVQFLKYIKCFLGMGQE